MLSKLRGASVGVLLLAAALTGPAACGELPLDEKARRELRRTPLVRLVERCAPSAVDLMSRTPGHTAGSGVIIHEAGYILTNNNVAGGSDPKATLFDGTSLPFRPVVRIPQENLAIVKVEGKALKAIKIGRSDDVMIGESVVVIGNPMLPHTVSDGVVTRVTRATIGGKSTTSAIQTNAALNVGNEGSPLINARGELIGVIQVKAKNLENVGHAMAIDRLRHGFAAMLSVENRSGFRLGLTVDPFGPAKVTKVAAGSPGAEAGVQVGDVIRRVAEMRVENVIHFHLALLGRKGGQVVPLELVRGGNTMTLKPTLAELPLRPAADVAGVVNGLHYSAYLGNWTRLPNFDKLKPANSGKTDKFSHTVAKVPDRFGLKFTGYIDVRADGLYLFYTASDDGSRLWIGDKLLVDNDGTHGVVEKNGSIRLKAGKHPIKVTFFEAGGGESLKVLYEGPSVPKQEVPPKALFVKP